MRKVELLSPARDLLIARTAINNGADAVYIGAPLFGARKAAGNSLEDIAKLVDYAHRFYCRVFVTLNTVLFDSELAEAERLIRQLYVIGVDALIVQDMGILKMDIPPITLHASTQMHNYDRNRIRFLDRLGFQRIVLARELSLEEIRAIRREVKAELEVFVHGALCVSLSGQCYLSQYMFGRSANRGECAQPCRMKWSLRDSAGKVLVKDKYMLSLKDLNLSDYIPALIDAGVDSFKIEGRLKEENYVANVTRYYHHRITEALKERQDIGRVGSGVVESGFEADPERSFNRGYTSYFFTGRPVGLVNMDTPKSMGKKIGKVTETKGNTLYIETTEEIANGDGLCYLQGGELKGIKVNTAQGNRLTTYEPVKMKPGTVLYRNYDHLFVTKVEKEKSVRKIRIAIEVREAEGRLELKVRDEDGGEAVWQPEEVFEEAKNQSQQQRILQQLTKCGESDFVCEKAGYTGKVLFIPSAVANEMRRMLFSRLSEEREKKRERLSMPPLNPEVKYKEEADWRCNVVNEKAAAFYREHGAREVAEGFEKGRHSGECELMCTRYCILHELGRCRKKQGSRELQFPLYLFNEKHCFRLEFDCGECFMRLKAKGKQD